MHGVLARVVGGGRPRSGALTVALTPAELLAALHRQVRTGVGEGDPEAVRERVGLIWRTWSTNPADQWAMVESPDGLGDAPDVTIAGERDHFAGLGIPLEWKTYSYDVPVDIGDRLVAAGFEAGDDEALMLGELADLVDRVPIPEGVSIREVRTLGDLRRIDNLGALVWGAEWHGPRAPVEGADSDPIERRDPHEYAVLAEESPEGPVLCAARVNLTPGTDFAGLWGGNTHPQWRGLGLYRAVLARRAHWALERGARYARVDASPNSEPILARLGLYRVATTTPYHHG